MTVLEHFSSSETVVLRASKFEDQICNHTSNRHYLPLTSGACLAPKGRSAPCTAALTSWTTPAHTTDRVTKGATQQPHPSQNPANDPVKIGAKIQNWTHQLIEGALKLGSIVNLKICCLLAGFLELLFNFYECTEVQFIRCTTTSSGNVLCTRLFTN